VTADDPSDTEVTGKSDGDNDANADSGKDADNDPTNDPVVVTLDQTASLSVTKSTTSTDKTVAGGATSFDVGDTITYSVAVTNTGNVSLDTVVLTDALLTGSPLALTRQNVTVTNEVTADDILEPGETWTHTYVYVITQSDIDAGEVLNTAVVTADDPSDTEVTGKSDGDNDANADSGKDADNDPTNDPVVVTLQAVPSLESWKLATLINDADSSGKFSAGDTLRYTITIKNTGNVTLSNVKVVSDTLSNGSLNNLTQIANFGASNFTTTVLPAVLAPNAELDFTADYIVTAADVSSGALFNTATVSGDFGGQTFTDVTHNEEDIDGRETNFSDSTVTGLGFEVADDRLSAQDRSGPVSINPLTNDAGGNQSEINIGTLQLIDSSNNRSNQVVVPGEGTWDVNNITGEVTFTPENGFTGSSVSISYTVQSNDGIPLVATITILFIDPRGVVYDDDTLQPIPGVQLVFVDQNGDQLPATCFPAGQQPQTTGADGRYQFDLSTACTDADGENFEIRITQAPGFELVPTSAALQAGPLNPGTPSSDVFEVVNYDRAPTAADPRAFFMNFIIGTNSRQIVNNHIALTALPSPVAEIQADLRLVLRNDLLATMNQQSRQISGYSGGALKRLQRDCVAGASREFRKMPISFANASSELSASSDKVLDTIAEILNECDEGKFEVAGHTDGSEFSNQTDSKSKDKFNIALSKARSEAVILALKDRGVNENRLVSFGYGVTRPFSKNTAVEGQEMNRRVELYQVTADVEDSNSVCDASNQTNNAGDFNVTESGVKANGSISGERRSCDKGGWNIWDGKVSYLHNDDGVEQGMLQFSLRNEQFLSSSQVAGRFIGGYASRNSVSGLATGTINGYGLNGGLYGAKRFDHRLYVDYYLGAALGQHYFTLDFDRAGGVVTADGDYYYYGFFTGAALSGQADIAEMLVTPRAGFDVAWSPGGEADYKASRGVTETDSLSTGEVYGARVFAEAKFSDFLGEDEPSVEFAPKVFCDRAIGSNENLCGVGARIELTKENDDGTHYGLDLFGEKTKSSETVGLGLEYGIPLYIGELSASGGVNQDRNISLYLLYSLGF